MYYNVIKDRDNLNIILGDTILGSSSMLNTKLANIGIFDLAKYGMLETLHFNLL